VNSHPLVLAINAVATKDGDGVVGDAAVLHELDCRVAAIATSILAVTSSRIVAHEPVPDDVLTRQLEAVLSEGRPDGARIGALGGPSQARLIAESLERCAPSRSVYAPIVQMAGARLLDATTLQTARREIFPRVRVVVLRAHDAEAWGLPAIGDLATLRAGAAAAREQGARAVIIAGLLVQARVIDLIDDGGSVTLLDASRVQAPHIPGLSGAYAAALAAHLARGAELTKAAEAAQRYVGLRLMRGR
jgi:hydroxymethylpyrimidine/phosphomethylpyrimidine kinase